MTIFTGDVLLASVKRAIQLPFNQNQLTDTDILAFADEEIAALIMPEILRLREEYNVEEATVPLVAGVSAYQVPRRASGRTLRDVEVQLASGSGYPLPQITRRDKRLFTNNATACNPEGFYFQKDKIVVVPSVGTGPTASLILSFVSRHSAMIQTSAARTVTNINTSTNTITLSSSLSSVSANGYVDAIGAASQPVILGYDIQVTNVAGASITLASVPSELSVGDWIAPAGQTPVLCLPEECGPAVSAATIYRVLVAQKDIESIPQAEKDRDFKIKSMREALAPRIEGEPQFIVNRTGLLSESRPSWVMRNLKV